MRKVIILLSIFISYNVIAWGPIGHRAIGQIADNYLSKKAKKQVKSILGHESLAIVTVWMDDIRSDSTYDYTHDWHWVAIPEGSTYEQTEKNPNGDIIAVGERSDTDRGPNDRLGIARSLGARQGVLGARLRPSVT